MTAEAGGNAPKPVRLHKNWKIIMEDNNDAGVSHVDRKACQTLLEEPVQISTRSPTYQVTFGIVVGHTQSGLSLLSSPCQEGAELEKGKRVATGRTSRSTGQPLASSLNT
jgi:hypothetical protein